MKQEILIKCCMNRAYSGIRSSFSSSQHSTSANRAVGKRARGGFCRRRRDVPPSSLILTRRTWTRAELALSCCGLLAWCRWGRIFGRESTSGAFAMSGHCRRVATAARSRARCGRRTSRCHATLRHRRLGHVGVRSFHPPDRPGATTSRATAARPGG